jgi:hypothetical protein
MSWDNQVNIWKLGDTRLRDQQGQQWESPQERAAERRAQRIARLSGEGNPPLPEPMPVINYSESLDRQEVPRIVAVATGPTLFQWDFELEAVGKDTDDEIKLLKDLSFAPNPEAADGGFGGQNGWVHPATGLQVNPTGDLTEDEKALGTQTVFKWYRIRTPFSIPTTETNADGEREWVTIENLGQILPIYAGQAEANVENGELTAKAPIVYGKWHDGEGDANNVTTVVPLPPDKKGQFGNVTKTEEMIVNQNYYIDTRSGIVKFRNPMVSLSAADYWQPAILRLRASFNRIQYSGEFYNREIFRTNETSASDTEPLWIRRFDLKPVRVPVWGPSASFGDVNIAINDPEIDKLANEHIDAVLDTFRPSRPQRIVYAGFYPQIDLDGVIRQIAYIIDSNNTRAPIQTLVDLDQDVSAVGMPSYITVRQREQLLTLRDGSNILTPSSWEARLGAEPKQEQS